MSNPRHQEYHNSQAKSQGLPLEDYPLDHRHSHPQGWKYGMCGCFSDCGVCCTGYWCPCILHGKTKHRMRHGTMEKYSCCNGPCMGFGCLVACLPPLYFIMGMRQRAEIRERYNIAGGGCGDYWRSLCCSCCSLIQEEREVRDRQKEKNVARGYQKPQGMVYAGGH
ncbi:PLAC8 family-domain-containing protein [Morchella snyderi]|nr:PLAC8 family-domain-containing protein [Morchella snyderi]